MANQPQTLEEAQRRAANIAMGDLLGCSEPPEGVSDQYPFNAVAFMKTLPQDWQVPVDRVIAYVYHNEDRPDWMKKSGEGEE